MKLPGPGSVRQAADRIDGRVHRTPVHRSRSLEEGLGCELHFKCENLQRTGAFKIRGATNAVMALAEEQAARGVATHSSGNHGAALALAARIRGIPCTVVMPAGSNPFKRSAVERYGAEIVECEASLSAREAALARVVTDTGAVEIPPFDHPDVIAGQGTAAYEFLEQCPELDTLLTPVGGGGLIAGTCLAASGRGVRVVGAEPALADAAARSLEAGERVRIDASATVADGLRASVGTMNLVIIREHVDGIVRVEEDAIPRAMRLVYERLKLVIEPSAAVPVAALMSGAVDATDRRVGIILSGGNVDLDALPW